MNSKIPSRSASVIVVVLGSTALMLAAPQQKPAATPAADGVPFTSYGATLLAVRFAPQAVEEEKLVRPIVNQIYTEQRLWQRFGKSLEGRGSGKWYRKLFGQVDGEKPDLIYEWQALANQPSALRDQLLTYFLDPAASVPGIADVFLFSRDKIEDREPRFAAQELLPVYKQHLELAAAKAPAQLWFSVPLPTHSYDFQKKAITFEPRRTNSISESLEPSDGRDLLSSVARDFYQPQDRARETAIYSTLDIGRGMRSQQLPPARPDSPTNAWRGMFSIGSSSDALPWPHMLAADRQLRITSFPLDVKVAEQLAKRSASLTARVFMTVVGAELASSRIDRQLTRKFSVLFVQIRRVEVRGPEDEVLATIQGASLPVPAAPAAKGAVRKE